MAAAKVWPCLFALEYRLVPNQPQHVAAIHNDVSEYPVQRIASALWTHQALIVAYVLEVAVNSSIS